MRKVFLCTTVQFQKVCLHTIAMKVILTLSLTPPPTFFSDFCNQVSDVEKTETQTKVSLKLVAIVANALRKIKHATVKEITIVQVKNKNCM